MDNKIKGLIKYYENELILVEKCREIHKRAGDDSFTMEYDASKECINEFITKLKELLE